eukprot:CAMPEP_0118666070 /NCGR_PEP_ID=MMETSP0785-20121206/19000_1 /TAXON_ID=91992 /ORGANISM="Bolidomonas pacifica, Strain CCMP 1866" /LENGTH=89 /DNA_ID=CAMNT_0006560319 /DNA_START=363 /DNA_END=629 /DNA_ORIENTATION=-
MDTFQYMKREMPEEICTVPVPVADPLRQFTYGSGVERCYIMTIPPSWNVFTTPFPSGNVGMLYKNDALGVSFTSIQKCMKYINGNKLEV